MKDKTLFELVCRGLPADIKPDKLYALASEEWWREKPFLACAYALRKCPGINWSAYSVRYGDVANLRLDPVLHYLKHGIFEGRKLVGYNPLCEPTPPTNVLTPEISIVVTNLDNKVFLEKCIRSIINQAVKNIEIIIVNESSDVDSLNLVSTYAMSDDRVRQIVIDNPCNLHMARKIGAESITGRYAMFLNPQDILEPNACEQALNEIEKGEDMLAFSREVIAYGPGGTSENNALWDNNAAPGVYSGLVKLDLSFCERTLNYTLANKIFTAPIVRMAFAMMEDGDFAPYEEVYEYLVLAFYARALRNCPSRICKSLFCPDHSPKSVITGITGANPVDDLATLGPIARFCASHNLERHYNNFKSFMLAWSCKKAASLRADEIWDYFSVLTEYFSAPDIVYQLSQAYQKTPGVISSLLARDARCERQGSVRKLGIYYYRMTAGGLERSIQNICRLLIPQGYEITLFLVEKTDRDLPLPPATRKFYVADSRAWLNSGKQHLADMHKALVDSEVETLMYMDVHSQSYLWDAILCGIMGIDIIGSIRLDHVYEYLRRGETYTHVVMLNAMKLSEKVVCLNTSTEIYLRSQGVDAECIPNAIQDFHTSESQGVRGNNVVVVARLGDQTKQIGECLKTLAALLDFIPDAKMIFVGNFDDVAQKASFYAKVSSLNLEDRVEVSGWVEDPAAFFDRAKALFSASFLEGFPNGIAEAQAGGLPVVMYDLDIELANDNESIIMIPQYDCDGAAFQLARIMRDGDEWVRLSHIARQRAKRFSEERFTTDMHGLLSTFRGRSRLKYYAIADYQKAISYTAFYAGKKLPRNGFN